MHVELAAYRLRLPALLGHAEVMLRLGGQLPRLLRGLRGLRLALRRQPRLRGVADRKEKALDNLGALLLVL